MRFETASNSDIGSREEQQDRVEVLEGRDFFLVTLADGMGGHEGGGLAAQAVVDAAREELTGGHSVSPIELLTSIVHKAHESLNAIGAARHISPHSTCVLLHLTSAAAAWAHVGDSRLYRFDNGRFVERTIDHSVVELMRLQGRITEEQMKTHPDQNRLYEALGGEETPEISIGQAEISEHDGFLLASDGLWENVSNKELEAVFEASDLQEALQGLVKCARARGGRRCDNISVAAARQQRANRSIATRVRRSLGLK